LKEPLSLKAFGLKIPGQVRANANQHKKITDAIKVDGPNEDDAKSVVFVLMSISISP
jgi:hypothetical protein